MDNLIRCERATDVSSHEEPVLQDVAVVGHAPHRVALSHPHPPVATLRREPPSCPLVVERTALRARLAASRVWVDRVATISTSASPLNPATGVAHPALDLPHRLAAVPARPVRASTSTAARLAPLARREDGDPAIEARHAVVALDAERRVGGVLDLAGRAGSRATLAHVIDSSGRWPRPGLLTQRPASTVYASAAKAEPMDGLTHPSTRIPKTSPTPATSPAPRRERSPTGTARSTGPGSRWGTA